MTKLRKLADLLPPSDPLANAEDRLAKLSGPPGTFDNPQCPANELWEEVLNGVLKDVLGWGCKILPRDIIRRGKDGLDGLICFVEYFVMNRGVEEGLFEGKLALLIEEMEQLLVLSTLSC